MDSLSRRSLGVSPCRRWPIPSIIFLGLQIARHLRFAALWVAHSFRPPPPPASYPATAPLWQSHEMIARTVSAALCSLEQLFRFDIVEKILATLMRIDGGLPYLDFDALSTLRRLVTRLRPFDNRAGVAHTRQKAFSRSLIRVTPLTSHRRGPRCE